jgi:hypothetical protein
MKTQTNLTHYYCYEKFNFNSKKDCLVLDLSAIKTNPKIGFIVREKTNNLGKTNSYTGRKFKLIKIQKQRFEVQDFVKYKNCYVRCYCCYSSEIVHRELWVLVNEDNK